MFQVKQRNYSNVWVPTHIRTAYNEQRSDGHYMDISNYDYYVRIKNNSAVVCVNSR